MPPKPLRRAGAARSQRTSPEGGAGTASPPGGTRLEVGEAEFVALCDALKASDSVREKAWRTYEGLAAADGAPVSVGGCGPLGALPGGIGICLG
ncbi:retinoblastoma-associated protein-like [Meleagris gallopavo]|uniref:retinoblastoma-associated protein-like n=1 Tax=Meleagris gallopavo TaxID=9103 RepID=UPI00093D601C|nr:retinoblastoma-associated protein-like [Meleagris gallopavo]